MAKKGKKSTEAESKAGQGNLARWLEDHPEHGNLRHGAYSRHVRARYTDLRTSEGRQLRAILQGLVADLGGQSQLTSAQVLILDRVREKLIILAQIGSFLDRQPSLVDEKGQLLSCLNKGGYTSIAESLRRDLETLYATSRKPKAPDLGAYLKKNYGEGNANNH